MPQPVSAAGATSLSTHPTAPAWGGRHSRGFPWAGWRYTCVGDHFHDQPTRKTLCPLTADVETDLENMSPRIVEPVTGVYNEAP